MEHVLVIINYQKGNKLQHEPKLFKGFPMNLYIQYEFVFQNDQLKLKKDLRSEMNLTGSTSHIGKCVFILHQKLYYI